MNGWFAIDTDGRVAHFDAGEGGATPLDVEVPTGDESNAWTNRVAPWIARQIGRELADAELPVRR